MNCRSLTRYYFALFLLGGLLASPQQVHAQATEVHQQDRDTSIFAGLVVPVGTQAVAPILKAIPDSVRVVGLGESSHFTKQYYDYKRAIIAELLTERDFEAVVFEVDYGTALEWDSFVTEGVGNIDTILYNCAWFTYQTEEFKEVLLSIRDINSKQAAKVRILGMEMTYSPGLLKRLQTVYDQAYNGSHRGELMKLLAATRDTADLLAFSYHNPAAVASLLNLSDLLRQGVDSLETDDLLKLGTNLPEVRMINNLFDQFCTYVASRNSYTQLKIRDQFSFDNIEWFAEIHDIDRYIVWAHSGHIQNRYYYAQLGSLLKYAHGEKYYSIGFDYGEGENGTIVAGQGLTGLSYPIEEETATAEFFQHYDSDVFLDLRLAERQQRLMRPVTIRNTFSESTNPDRYRASREVVLPEINDGMIFVREVRLPTKSE